MTEKQDNRLERQIEKLKEKGYSVRPDPYQQGLFVWRLVSEGGAENGFSDKCFPSEYVAWYAAYEHSQAKEKADPPPVHFVGGCVVPANMRVERTKEQGLSTFVNSQGTGIYVQATYKGEGLNRFLISVTNGETDISHLQTIARVTEHGGVRIVEVRTKEGWIAVQ